MRHHLIFALLLILLWQTVSPTRAQEAIKIGENEVTVEYPRRVIFRLSIDNHQALRSVSLLYKVDRNSCLESQIKVPVEPAQDGSLQWEWVLNRSGNPPPGTEVTWWWSFVLEDGSSERSEQRAFTFSDQRFDWQLLGTDGVRLHWHDDSDVAHSLLEAAKSGLERIETEMGIQLQEAVDFFIYENSTEMRDAVIYRQDWAGALAFYNYNTILMGVHEGNLEGWGKRTVVHELAHLLVGQSANSCVGGKRPNWLDEGLATYAEGEPDGPMRLDLSRGIEDDRFLPLRSLNGSFPADADAARMAYSQSYSVVAYLLQEYGQESMRALLQLLADGARYDAALEEVYGVNTDGLETAWRRHLGAPPRAALATPTPLLAAEIPTVAPITVPRQRATPEAPAASPSSPARRSICILPGLLPLAALLLLARGQLDRRHPR